MALPANWQAANSPPASRFWLILIGTLICSLFLATFTLYLIIIKSGFLIQWKVVSPEVKHFLDFLGVGAPYLISMALLLIPNSYTRALASGIASVTAVIFLYWEGLLFAAALLGMFFEQSPAMREPGPSASSIAIVVALSLLCHLSVFFSSQSLFFSSLVLTGRNWRSVPVFLLGAILAWYYAQGVYRLQQSSQTNYGRAIEDIDKESTGALKTVESISWSAIEFSFRDSEMVALPPGGRVCYVTRAREWRNGRVQECWTGEIS